MTLGNELYNLTTQTQETLFEIGQYFQLTYSSYESMIKNISESQDEEWTLKFPMGVHAGGSPMIGTQKYQKKDLIDIYDSLIDNLLPLNSIYYLVTICESFFVDAIQSILIRYPKKIAQNRQIKISHIFECSSLESIHLSIINEYINEITYLSPKDFAYNLESIFGYNLYETPVFHKYVELKATRDVFIHNKGIANYTYIRKTGSHARVKDDQELPMNIGYFLTALECCMQLVETIGEEFHKTWPSAIYEEREKKKEENNNSKT